jgi:UDP-galactopyranose mutase
VGQTALYRELSNKVPELAYTGRLAYKAIDQTAVLNQVIRQGGNNTRNAVFRSALAELYNNTIGKLTWRLLLSRCKQNLPTNKITSFNDAI